MKLHKNPIGLVLLLAILFLPFVHSIAQSTNAPDWMSYVVRDEITKNAYLESQKVLDPYSISTVYITMDPNDYSQLILDTGNEAYFEANMTYESPTIPLQNIEQVGIRLRGAAARGSLKKSFKISFRSFGHDDREFFRLRKLNLNCDFQDPHLMRAKTCTDLFRLMGVDAARVGYTKLFINNEYRGLFANYEEFDKAFLATRFEDKNGNLYKCDGASMQNGSGGYRLTTNEELGNYNDILEFIEVLNNTPTSEFKSEIEKVFDVDKMLMYAACNVLLGAWDDYWVLAKNFYFYHDLATDQFKYIPHDFDGSLGTDWYHGDIALGNVYNWSPNPGRPMVDKLLEVPEYRDRYTHFLMLLCMYPFSLDAMEPEIDRTADMIRETLTSDPYWGWNPADFDLAFDQAITQGSVKYGMKEYIKLRRESALEQLEKIGPYIKQIDRSPMLPNETDPVTIAQLVVDREKVDTVTLVYNVGNTVEEIIMLDDGIGSDEEANDYVYTAQIPAQKTKQKVMYFVKATNASGKTSRYPVANKWADYSIDYEPPVLFVNELLAQNDSTNTDQGTEYDDWFELYNPGDESINLQGMYVSDNILIPRKWRLGNLSIPAKGFLLLWADGDTEQGANHVSFKLSGGGEELGLFDRDERQNTAIDFIRFEAQVADVSYGRTQDGNADWIFFKNPTPGYGNRDTLETHEDLFDITDLGGQITEANNNSPSNESIGNAIDNRIGTKYLTFQESTWIEYSLPELSLVQGYAVFSANDSPERDPANWEFQAYDEENHNWVTLHKVDNEPHWTSRFQSKEFYFSNSNSYYKYRLYISSAHGADIVQLAELEIYGIMGGVPNGVEENLSANLSVFPNPVNDVLHISGDSQLKEIRVHDLSGRILKQIPLQGEFRKTLDVDDLGPGIYILNIETIEGNIKNSKFLKL